MKNNSPYKNVEKPKHINAEKLRKIGIDLKKQADELQREHEKLKEELASILDPTGVRPQTKEKPITFDGKQYTVRIPKRFAEAIGLDVKRDKIRFTLIVAKDRKTTPNLIAEVAKNE